jgi:6-phosphogluconolactonase
MTHHIRLGLVSCILAVALAMSAVRSFAAPMELVFVGSGRANITAYWLDMTSGTLRPSGQVTAIAAPSFLAISPNQGFLYAVSEGQTRASSMVSAFRIDPSSGALGLINQRYSDGAGPCYVAVDHRGMNVLVANYGSGSVSVFPIVLGGLGPMSASIQDYGSSVNPQRQAGPHAHCIVTDANDRYAFVCDLGLDKVMIYNFDPSAGTLAANNPPFIMTQPGAGPRHIAFHPNGLFAYVINEMASTLTAYAYDAGTGVLREIETQPLLPKFFMGQNTAAEVAVHPSGNFVYASNRGDDSIIAFACDPATGRLRFIQRIPSGGRTPRNFEIDPTGEFLLAANQNSGNVVVFHIDGRTGQLSPTGIIVSVDTPECVKCLNLQGLAVRTVPMMPVPIVPSTPTTPSSPTSPASPTTPFTPTTPTTPPTEPTPFSPSTPATPSAPSSPSSPTLRHQ